MVQITLAINGLLDQQVGLRPGGLYWLSIDQLADAKILARQFLAALEQTVSATLITCAHAPQSFINELPADSGPGKLRLFEIAPPQIKPALETLTRDLGRIGIAPSSVLLLILPASHWGDTTSVHKLQRWCERMRPWLRERQATLLVITHGEAEHLHSKLLTLNEQLSGLSRLYRFNGDIRYQLHFWHTEQGCQCRPGTQAAAARSDVPVDRAKPGRNPATDRRRSTCVSGRARSAGGLTLTHPALVLV